ncbi:MarR family winged helix-turn-helix transcriptional regulator [Malikia sp.]|uniref:MarR family winged helix-turn-helix transcriptional regulator n=1 Tax=Malikia sp. TaxID=2070706 RepID=UPI00261396DF|nr:MarR family winged helix-turn-helix transcriptional regulator [Malikia sp.]MDD2727955.1 MarR family winged helix-turn-helix transcriptional regulator [Malikia sp.]
MPQTMTEPSPVRHPTPPPPMLPQPEADPGPVAAGLAVERVDTSFLEALIGYNARRAALTIIATFIPRMAQFGLRPVEFSVLTLIGHNPGITARQLCATLDLQPPNLVGMIKGLEKRSLLEKRDHPNDRRAQGLHLTAEGESQLEQAQATALALEIDATPRLTPLERVTLLRLLRKIYQPDA